LALRKFFLPLAFALVCALSFGLWFSAHWPGLYNYDTFQNFQDARNGISSAWVSHIYSDYLIALFWISKTPGFVGLFQLTLAVVLSTLIFSWAAQQSHRRLVFLFAFFFAISPINPIMTIFYMRDWLFSWMLFALATGFAFCLNYFRSKPMGWFPVAALSLLSLLVSLTRQDSFLVVVVLPFLFLLLKWDTDRPACRRMIAFGLLAIVAMLYFNPMRDSDVAPAYAMTGVINPLSAIINHPHVAENPEQDAIVIDRVLDLNLLKKYQDDYEIPAFHHGAYRESSTASERENFFKVYFRLIKENPLLFLNNRLKMGLALMGTADTMYYSDDLIYALAEERVKFQEHWPDKAPISKNLNVVANRITDALFQGSPWVRFLLASHWIPLLASLIALFLFAKFPITAAAAAIILVRVPVVFLASPAPHYNYLYSVDLFALMIVPLMWMERRRTHASASQSC